MKIKGIRLSEVVKSLEVLKKLCLMHEKCSTCWLYDPEEKETACFLVKTAPGSLAVNIEETLEYIAQEQSCIMPECPYCPTCSHGHISHPEESMPGEEGLLSTWHCTYDPEVRKSETAADEDSLADAPGADPGDRSGA